MKVVRMISQRLRASAVSSQLDLCVQISLQFERNSARPFTMIHVYFCGAHSTGKTTLQKELGKDEEFLQMGFEMQPEIARHWVEDNGYTQEKLQVPENLLRLNKELLQQQFLAEKKFETDGTESYDFKGCLWDRGLVDPLCYIRYYFGKDRLEEALNMPCAKEMLQRWRTSGRVVVILFPPVRKMVRDDGVRLNADWEDICRISETMETILKELGVEYHVLESIDLAKRIGEVKALIKESASEIC